MPQEKTSIFKMTFWMEECERGLPHPILKGSWWFLNHYQLEPKKENNEMRLEKAVQKQASTLVKDSGCHSSVLSPERGNQQLSQGHGRCNYLLTSHNSGVRAASLLAGLPGQGGPPASTLPHSWPMYPASSWIKLSRVILGSLQQETKDLMCKTHCLGLGAGTVMPAFVWLPLTALDFCFVLLFPLST